MAAVCSCAFLTGCSPVIGLFVRAVESARDEELVVTLDTPVEGSTRDAPDRWRPTCGAPDGGGDRAYRLDIEEAGRYRIDVTAGYDSVVAIFGADGGALDCNDDAGRTTHSMIERDLEPGRYTVVVDGFRGETGDYALRVERVTAPPPQPDGRALRERAAVRGDTNGREDRWAPPCGPTEGSPDEAWTFTPAQSGTYVLMVHAAHDAVLAVYPPEGEGDAPLACNDDYRDPRMSRLDVELVAGRAYRVVVDGADGAAGPYSLRVLPRPAPRVAVRGVIAPGRTGRGDTARAEDVRSLGCGVVEGSGDEVWRFRATEAGRHRFQIESEHRAALAVVEHGQEAPLACAGDDAQPLPLEMELSSGHIYDLVVDGVGGAAGPYALSVEPPSVVALDDADDPAFARACLAARPLHAGVQGGRFEGVGVSGTSCGRSGGPDTLYRFRAGVRTRLAIRAESTAPPTLALVRGCVAPEPLACVAPTRGRAELDAVVEAGEEVIVIVDSASDADALFTLDVRMTAEPER